MKIALLTSSRADYGIYRPLIQKLVTDSFFEIKIIAFGTHLSHFHGYTIQEIEKDGFEVAEKIESMVLGDSPESISSAMGLTQIKFSGLWAKLKNEIDLIICLGDRYEMLAAVLASVPFQIPVAHLHGGETTLGAIDNIFRHSLSLMASLHFTSTEAYAQKVAQLTEKSDDIYNVGALSLDNLHSMQLLSLQEFKEKYYIDLEIPTVLFTFHPETVNFEKNEHNIIEISKALEELYTDYQIVITMPNADTNSRIIREKLLDFSLKRDRVFVVESFGTLGYFSCLKHCSFVMGNSSSGIIEAASFGKYVLNLGKRQEGRASGENVIHLPVVKAEMISAVKRINSASAKKFSENLYGTGNAGDTIIKVLKSC